MDWSSHLLHVVLLMRAEMSPYCGHHQACKFCGPIDYSIDAFSGIGDWMKSGKLYRCAAQIDRNLERKRPKFYIKRIENEDIRTTVDN